MPRYKRNEGLFQLFIHLPWQVSIAAGLIAFAGMYWALPAWLSGHLYFASVPSLARQLAWLLAVLFSFTAFLSYLKNRHGTAKPSATKVEHDWKDFANEPLFDESTTQTGAEWILTAGRINRNTSLRRFDAWSIEALRALEWKRFEQACARYYELTGLQAKTIRAGADGGIDITLFKSDPDRPIAVVQCKAWNTADVGVKEIRELLGVMSSQKIAHGIFIATGGYTRDALAFGEANPIQLLDGKAFLQKIAELPQDRQIILLKFAFEGDYSTPSCPSCGIKMAKRDSKHGPFWGCLNYPRCRSRFHFRSKEAPGT